MYNDDIMFAPTYDDFEESGSECTAKKAWTIGTSQIFGSVSKEMHEEFESSFNKVFARFGKVYYGCCEPLHNRIDMIGKLKNVVKVSVSPWADIEMAAEQIGGKYVYSRKPNPAWIAGDTVNWKEIENDIRKVKKVCTESGSTLEYILKDISTVQGQIQRLTRWVELAKNIIEE